MKTYTTNTGHEVEADTIERAISKTVESLVATLSERAGCRMKQSKFERFTVPRHKVEAVRLILEPDLPEFITGCLNRTPTLDASFTITEAVPEGELYEVENNKPFGLSFLYSGEWEEVAKLHAYFIVGLGALRDGEKPGSCFIEGLSPAGGGLSGKAYLDGQVSGLVHVKGKKLPKEG